MNYHLIERAPPNADWPRRHFLWLATISLALLGCSQTLAQPKNVFRPINLNPFSAATNSTLESALFPRGAQTFEGIPFAIDRAIEVTGVEAARHGEFMPPQVPAMPVYQKVQRVHLLL